MNFGKKEGIVVVGEIQKREIMPLTLELIGAAGKLSKERDLSLSVILSGCGIKEEAKKLYNYGVDEILCIEDEKLIEGHMQLHHDAVIEVLKRKGSESDSDRRNGIRKSPCRKDSLCI